MAEEKGRTLKDARAGDPVALARALVATPSVNPEIEESGAGEAEVAELTAGCCGPGVFLWRCPK